MFIKLKKKDKKSSYMYYVCFKLLMQAFKFIVSSP